MCSEHKPSNRHEVKSQLPGSRPYGIPGNARFAGAGVAIGTIILVLVSPMLLLMWRDFRRSRWLDPDSLPSEWEIAAIRDPKSINYRPPKVKKRK